MCEVCGGDAAAQPEMLVVLLHGLRGSHHDYDACVSELRRSAQHPMVVCRPTCNDGRGLHAHTARGTLHSARRAFSAVVAMLCDYPSARAVKSLVLVGHSFGGIYGRMVATLLADEGILVQGKSNDHAGAQTNSSTSVKQKLVAEQFITFASPHLGIRRPRNGPWYYWRRAFNSIFHSLAPVIGGFTGRELLHADESKLLVRMGTEEKYLRALRMFRKRVCYGNVFLDLQVPLCTSAILTRNPFRGRSPLSATGSGGKEEECTYYRYHPKYHSILELCGTTGTTVDPSAFSSDAEGGAATRLMQHRLNELGWERIYCYVPPDAHNMIIGNNRAFVSGKDILRHLSVEVMTPPTKE